MKGKTKRILAFLCAVVLVATTFLGSWYTKQAKAANDVVPVSLDGYDNITIKDYAGLTAPGTCVGVSGGNGTYTGGTSATNYTDFDKVLLSMKLTFTAGTYTTRMEFGSNTKWGLSMYPTADGKQLKIYDFGSFTNMSKTNLPVMDATVAGVDSFLNDEFLLQMSFDYGAEVGGRRDVTIGIYIDGKLYNNAAFTITGCDATKLGSCLGFYGLADNGNITYDNLEVPTAPVEPQPVKLDGYENVTIKDYAGLTAPGTCAGATGNGTYTGGTSATNHTDLDKVLLSMKLTFTGGTYTTRMEFGSNTKWGLSMYPTADGKQLKIYDFGSFTNMTKTNLPVMDATVAGVDSFLNDEFLLQMSFDYGAEVGGRRDVTIGIYIDGKLYNNAAFTITGCDATKLGSNLGFYSTVVGGNITYDNLEVPTAPVGPQPVELDGYDNVTIKDYAGLTAPGTCAGATGNGTYTGGTSATNHTDLDKVLLSMKITFTGGTYTTRMEFGSNSKWGLSMYPTADGKQLKIYDFGSFTNMTKTNLPVMDATVAGVDSFLNDEFLLQMSFDYGAEVSGRRDVTIGIYIDGKLYNDETFTITGCDATKLGSNLGFYSTAEGGDITYDNIEFPSAPVGPQPVELDGYKNLTIKDFHDADDASVALTPGTGTSTGYKRYKTSECTNFDKVLLSMKVNFASGTYATRLDVGGTGWYSGLWIHPSNAAGDELKIVSPALDGNGFYGMTDASQSFAITTAEADVNKFVGEEFILQLAFDFGEEVSGKTDLTIGVYINGKLAKTHTLTGCNVAKLGNHLNFNNGASITYDNVEFPAAPTGPQPVELDGYKNLTIRDFHDADDASVALTPGTGTSTGYKRYKTSECTNFDKVLLSMKVNFASGTYATRLDVGGTGWYSGLWIHPSNATGDELWIVSPALDGNGFYGITDASQSFAITATEADVNKFVGEEFILQLAFDFGEEVSGKTDLTIGVYINGKLAKTHTLTGCNVAKLGNHLNFNNGASITYDNVILSTTPGGPGTPGGPVNPPVTPGTPVVLDGFRNLTISDFVGNSTHTQGTTLTEGRYEAPNYYGYDVKGVENFDRKLLSLNVTFEAGGWQNSIMFGGNGQWVGFNLYPSADGSQLFVSKTWGSTITTSATPILSAQTAGVDSFVGEEFLLQMSFEYGQEIAGKADLKLGIYIEGILYNNQVFTIANCNTNTFGDRLAFYPQTEGQAIIIGEEVDMPKSDDYEEETLYQKITFDSFGIADGKYTYVSGKTAVSGTALGRETLNKTVICGDILYEGSDNSQIIWGGTSAMNGLRMNPKSDGTMELAWYDGNSKTPIATLDSKTAGVVFIGEKYNIKLSSELVDADKDGKVNDLKIGISFNGLLYNKEYFYVNDMGDKYGSYFSVYCAEKGDTVTLNSAPELVSRKPNADFEKVTFEYFALADGTYKCDGTDQSTFSSKGLETLDRKVLCGDILIDGEGRHSIMLGGKQIWYGLRFITQADGSILLIWVDEDGTPFIETFNSAIAGTTLIGEWMNLMISTEIVDADGDGEKDDIEFGFWFNGVLYNDKYYTVIDKASRLGKCFGFDCAEEGTSISVRSIPEYVKGFDYSIYGLTEDWEKTLLDTGFKVYNEVGGSRNPEPFTGDSTAIGNALRVFGTAMIVAIGACVCVVLQRRKNRG